MSDYYKDRIYDKGGPLDLSGFIGASRKKHRKPKRRHRKKVKA